MLYREEANSLIVIAQPAHAWVSGQLARAWGNERFGAVEPWEEVCLGAEQHDLGWTEWEQHPTIHPRTGRPRRFFELPTGVHVGIWQNASQKALTMGRYPALLVSLHVAGLYARHDYGGDTPEEAQAARDFLAQERAFQDRLLASLRVDTRYAPFATPEAVRRNQRLVAVWDGLSLVLCAGRPVERQIEDVPAVGASVPLTVAPVAGMADCFSVDPWPFRAAVIRLVYEGRRIGANPFADDAALRAALAAAPWVTLETTLTARDPGNPPGS